MKKLLIPALCAVTILAACTKKDGASPAPEFQAPSANPPVTSSPPPTEAVSVPPQENPGSGEMPTTNPSNPAVNTTKTTVAPTTAPTPDGTVQKH